MTEVVDWLTVLRTCPNLQRLDLSKMAYLTRRETSQYCLKMKVVVLPMSMRWSKRAPKNVGAYRNNIDDDALVIHLSAALERWAPTACDTAYSALSSQYAVTRFCPNAEVLDGWKLTYVSDEWEWGVSLEVWENFCKQCVDLREFDLRFLRAFWIYTKVPINRSLLVLETTIGLMTRAEQLIRAWTLQAAAPVKSVINPEILVMLLHFIWSLLFGARHSCDFLHPQHRIDLDVIDNDFLTQLPKSSPYLSQFSFSEAGIYAGPQSLECVSDQGLLSLASTTHLSDISTAAVSCTTLWGASRRKILKL
ncbi:hypothetical protein P3T76_008365 [Phytophthora citrophthora]|uniref:Uncharacterized protein n=1 Tax=Phytophthora citrophthora TaxID=4793 RepID=A0AAD9LLI0_9STRA|nr:hypothetical protein P3T76_008365 [Phytophthora citrophthora]